MDPETRKIIQESFKKLPARLQEAILAAELPEKFRTIMTKHKLQIDQAADVENETMLVMLGLEHLDDYTKNITREAELDETKAHEIAEDVNRIIFLPIRNSLREFHRKEAAEEDGEEEAAEISNAPRATAPQQTRETEKQPTSSTSESHTDIFKEKMGGMMRMPKEETSLNLTKTRAPQPPQKAPSGKDLYREPVEELTGAEFKKEPVTKETSTTERRETNPDISKTNVPTIAKAGLPAMAETKVGLPAVAEAKAGAPPANLPTGPKFGLDDREKKTVPVDINKKKQDVVNMVEEKEKKGPENEPPPIVIGRLPESN